MLVEAVARHLLARREPDTGQRLHPGDEAVQHGYAQGAPGYERVQADVEIAALAVLLQEAAHHMSNTLSVSERRCSAFALAYQAKLKNMASSMAK